MSLFSRAKEGKHSYSSVPFNNATSTPPPPSLDSSKPSKKVSSVYKTEEILEEEAKAKIREREAKAIKTVKPATIRERTVIDNTVRELEEEIAGVLGIEYDKLEYSKILELTMHLLKDNVKLMKTVNELKKNNNSAFAGYRSWDDQAPSWN